MKNLNDKERIAIFIIVIMLVYFGAEDTFQYLSELKLFGINLLELAFCGILSFFITGVIMRIADKTFGIWFGKTGGAILYTVTTFILSITVF